MGGECRNIGWGEKEEEEEEEKKEEASFSDVCRGEIHRARWNWRSFALHGGISGIRENSSGEPTRIDARFLSRSARFKTRVSSWPARVPLALERLF